MEEGRGTKKTLEGKPASSRMIGRPRTRWIDDVVEYDLRAMSMRR